MEAFARKASSVAFLLLGVACGGGGSRQDGTMSAAAAAGVQSSPAATATGGSPSASGAAAGQADPATPAAGGAAGDSSEAVNLGGASGTEMGGSAGDGALTGTTSCPVPSGNAVVFDVGDRQLRLEVCAENIVRVQFAEDREFFARATLATAPKQCDPSTPWDLSGTATHCTLTTAALKARVEIGTGNVAFLDVADQALLAERSRILEPAEVQGESVYHAQQQWEPNADEAFYGLGQHQQNLMNIKGYPLDLVQYNTQIVVPFVVSSRGYGILWDNTSYTRWGDLADFVSLNDNGGGYQGEFTADTTGDYIFRTYSSGQIRLSVDDEVLIDHWRQGWLPDIDYARVPLQAGQTCSLALDFTSDIDVEIADLAFKPPADNPATSLWSNVADGIDYTFVYGPHLDTVVRGYRQLSGQAPMMPRWAFGLWQSRERYEDADELLGILEDFRSLDIPLDTIVQDWQYWTPGTWGSHAFDASRFPDPAGLMQQIHEDYNARLMIAVWPKFHTGTENFDALNAAGSLYQLNLDEGIEDFTGQVMTFYDAFNPNARELYWSQISQNLFSVGVDAWWLDATEPEIVEGPYESPEQRRSLYETHMHPTALGSGARMLNAFSLVNSQAVYEGQRAEAPNQRVFILTRSAFTGQQRYAAASWSGDISTTWTALRKQIPAGLGFTLSGIPYWTMDVGGFAEHPDLAGDDVEWGELCTRWFQYGTFTPLLRVHGQDDRVGPREMYNLNAEAFEAQLKFDRLRYRLLPYVYSLAGAVTHDAGTIMRPLVMDFRDDPNVLEIGDSYMFGPAFLVSPVTTYGARQRDVYLPPTPGGWYDFWTGTSQDGGRTITALAAYDSLPVYVRAGSIVPTGPELMYTDQAPPDPITLYVYAGADAEFVLYEDDGQTYDYEAGAFARTSMSWSDATRTLTLGAPEGSFPGMIQSRTFDIVLVEPGDTVGFSFTPVADTTVHYEGTLVSVAL